MEVFEAAARRHGSSPALRVELEPFEGKYRTWTWSDYYHESLRVARGFLQLGLQRHGSVVLMGFNHPAWVIRYEVLSSEEGGGSPQVCSVSSSYISFDACGGTLWLEKTIFYESIPQILNCFGTSSFFFW